MPQVFRTAADYPDDVVLVGIGVIGARGKGGIPIAQAAQLGMAELQQKDDTGAYAYDEDGALQPLQGAALGAAAKHYIDAHPYLVLENVKEGDLDGLRYEAGAVRDEYPPAGEKAVAEYAGAAIEDLRPVNASGDVMATATVAEPGVGTPSVPDEEVSS